MADSKLTLINVFLFNDISGNSQCAFNMDDEGGLQVHLQDCVIVPKYAITEEEMGNISNRVWEVEKIIQSAGK